MRPFKVKNILELFWVEGHLKIAPMGAEAGIPWIYQLIRSAARTTASL